MFSQLQTKIIDSPYHKIESHVISTISALQQTVLLIKEEWDNIIGAKNALEKDRSNLKIIKSEIESDKNELVEMLAKITAVTVIPQKFQARYSKGPSQYDNLPDNDINGHDMHIRVSSSPLDTSSVTTRGKTKTRREKVPRSYSQPKRRVEDKEGENPPSRKEEVYLGIDEQETRKSKKKSRPRFSHWS